MTFCHLWEWTLYDIIIISKENEHKRTEASAIVGADARSFFATR